MPVSLDRERWTGSKVALLDIEGTISSISFVKDVLVSFFLFPSHYWSSFFNATLPRILGACDRSPPPRLGPQATLKRPCLPIISLLHFGNRQNYSLPFSLSCFLSATYPLNFKPSIIFPSLLPAVTRLHA
ncbi:hypothetical protein P280DRAFT_330481 [Massarina eburnea CBS 473.64]|uniref:Uncharacterized protein n=1 Tax=Massarina eburnea CBS 473.64 TaxID=1395130 RepID=A0A6A6S2I1_9PLEO|nr:hypothetical protein P280DRAFT_330481 [Massarina eburnea CBS 473.64]